MRRASHREPGRGRNYPRSYAEPRAWLTRTRFAWTGSAGQTGSSALVAAASPGGACPTPGGCAAFVKRKGSATAGTIFAKNLPARLTREWTRGIVNSRRSTNTPGLAQHGRATWGSRAIRGSQATREVDGHGQP